MDQLVASGASMPRNSHQDALDDEEFERLLDATETLDEDFERQCYAILILAGRLGMRAGEICHFSEEWVDRRRKMIRIPSVDPCECGYCRQQAELAVEHADDLTMEEAMEHRWEPKTQASVRTIPYDFSPRVEAAVEAFVDEHGDYDRSRASINRRVDRVAEAAGFDKGDIYPHALRATAATHHAYRGLPAPALQNMMGWSKLGTATKYIRLTGEATADALREAHSE